jgi:prepilin-type N-terminal cleavage/methylation domain-containing protein
VKLIRKKLQIDESGFSLVEVLVAISVIAIVATSAGILTMSGIQTSTTQERKQIAVTIASGAMETANARSAATNTTTKVSDLLTNRLATDVAAAFTAQAGKVGVAQTYQAWDPTALGVIAPAIPITATVIQSGTTFAVTTLIGTCYEKLTGGDCTILPGYLLAPVVTPTGYTQILRVIVVVSWTAGSGCSGGGCFYATTSLIDSHTDLEWVSHG